MNELQLIEAGDGIAFRVTVRPKSRTNCMAGVRAGELLVCVTAAPDRGEANRAVIDTLAAWLAVPRSHIAITSGHTSRHKRVCVRKVTRAAVMAQL